MKYISRRGFSVLELLIVLLLFILVPSLLLSPWTDRQLDFWLTYSKGVPTNCPWGISWLASIIWPLALLLDIISEIVRLFA